MLSFELQINVGRKVSGNTTECWVSIRDLKLNTIRCCVSNRNLMLAVS